MNNELNDLLYFMQVISGNVVLSEERLNRIDWQYIRKSSRMNALGLFVYDLAYKHGVSQKESERSQEDSEFWCDWKEETQWQIVHEIQKQYALRRVIEKAEGQGLQPVLFKGSILADLYYDAALRSSTDSDIYIDPKDGAQMTQILLELGYEYVEEHSKPQVPVYYQRGIGHCIELHFCLWEDYTGSRMKLLEEMELTRPDTLVRVKLDGFEVTTLEPTRHLIYQMFHIIKHFTVQGVGLRYLLDITLFVNAYNKQIDRTFFWSSMDKLGYTIFCEKFLTMCHEYFGLKKIMILQHERTMQEKEEEIFLFDLLNIGEVFQDRNLSWEMLTIMKPYLEGETIASKSKIGRMLHLMFPMPRELPNHCGYAKKIVVLLPIAWIHKWFLFVWRRLMRGNQKMSASKKMQAAEYRIGMLKNMGLLNEEQK